MTWVRGVLAVTLLGSVYAVAILVSVGELVLATVLAIKGIPPVTLGETPTQSAAAMQTPAHQFGNDLVADLYLGGIAASIVVLYPVLRAGGKTGRVRDSVVLSRRDAPRLWAMVTELAAELGTRPPAEVRVVALANAAVSEECRFLGLVVGVRRLYVGLPLLLGLTVDELRAVLCHELGHYARGHTRTGPVIYRGAVALDEVLTRRSRRSKKWQDGTALAALPFILYSAVWYRLTAALRRQQEIEADAAAVAAAGKAATAQGLRGVYALARAWEGFLRGPAGAVLRNGFTPGGLFDGFSAMLADPQFREVLAGWRGSPADAPPTPFDSHPGFEVRLRQIAAREDSHRGQARDRDPGPAFRLLATPQQVLTDAAALVWPQRMPDHPPLAWPEWADLAAEAIAVADAEELLAAARRVAAEPAPTLSTVLDLLRDGAAGYLAAALARGVTGGVPGSGPGGGRGGPGGGVPGGGVPGRGAPGPGVDAPPRQTGLGLLRARLGALAGCALVQTGYARWRLSWTGPGTLTGIDISLADFPGLVEAAVRSPARAQALRDRLTGLGVAVDVPPTPARVSVPPEDGAPPRPGGLWPGGLRPGSSEAEAAARRHRRRRRALIAGVIAVATAIAISVVVGITRSPQRPAAALPDPADARLPDNGVGLVVFSPDGKILVTAYENGRAYLWNAAARRVAARLPGPPGDAVNAAAFSPGGKTLAVALGGKNGNGSAYLWNVATRRVAASLTGPAASDAAALAFSPDGKTLAVGVDDGGDGAVYLWNVATRRVVARLPSPGGVGVPAVAFSPDGQTLAASDSSGSLTGDVALWDVVTRRITRVLTNPGTWRPARWRSAPTATRWPPAPTRSPTGARPTCGISPAPRPRR
jgi:Zn-dependent protease with chaperone function/DNA-binding beta-propeller fold protein YncE